MLPLCPWPAQLADATARSPLKSIASHDDSEPTWQTAATACRWGIVVICMILVPGVAFIGQGIGRWLRDQSTNRWATRLPAEPPAMPAPRKPDSAGRQFPTADTRPPVSAGESAAMYSGRQGGLAVAPPTPPPARDADVISTSFGAVSTAEPGYPSTDDGRAAVDRFTELERQLQAQGAISYVLESDRRSRHAYRFECVMPGVGPGARERTMEAFGDTALDAIQNVVWQLNVRPSKSR